MKTALLILVSITCALVRVDAADRAAALKTLGGEFDAVTGAVTVKKNKAPDVAAIAALVADPAIKTITLHGCTLKSDGLAALAKSTSLTSLNLTHTMVNKVEDLKLLARVQTLERLDLGGSNFGDAGLAALCELRNLKSLQLGHVGRDDRNFFTAAGLRPLANLPKLEVLMLHFHKPDDAMISALASLKSLKDVKIGGISSDYLKKLQAALPQAKVASRGPTTDAQKK